MFVVAEESGTVRKVWTDSDVSAEQAANAYAKDLTTASPGVIFHVLKTKSTHGKLPPRADAGKPYGSIIFKADDKDSNMHLV